ncbi:MAG TPA: hypothetical protein VK187_01795, partial [Geobacteraceae bacterium]|nr:hypothetical protein [Geobacteraceae bacterium]
LPVSGIGKLDEKNHVAIERMKLYLYPEKPQAGRSDKRNLFLPVVPAECLLVYAEHFEKARRKQAAVYYFLLGNIESIDISETEERLPCRVP